MCKKISDLKPTAIRNSIFSLDYLIEKCSSINPMYKDEIEAYLCLANEIKALKEEIKTLKNGNTISS